MEKHFSRTRRARKWDENHRKCDNKNEIYELRLVIYLCANLLLQSDGRGRGCDFIMSHEKGKVVFTQKSFSCSRNDKLAEELLEKNGNSCVGGGREKPLYFNKNVFYIKTLLRNNDMINGKRQYMWQRNFSLYFDKFFFFVASRIQLSSFRLKIDIFIFHIINILHFGREAE